MPPWPLGYISAEVSWVASPSSPRPPDGVLRVVQTTLLSQLDELRRDLITVSYESLEAVHIAKVQA